MPVKMTRQTSRRGCLRPGQVNVTEVLMASGQPGRPRLEDEPLTGSLATRLNHSEVRAFERWAKELGLTPSRLLRILIRNALKQKASTKS